MKVLLEVEVRFLVWFFLILDEYIGLNVYFVFIILNEQTQVPLQQQELLFNGKEMSNSEKLGALGVTDGDLVMMVSNASSSGARFV